MHGYKKIMPTKNKKIKRIKMLNLDNDEEKIIKLIDKPVATISALTDIDCRTIQEKIKNIIKKLNNDKIRTKEKLAIWLKRRQNGTNA